MLGDQQPARGALSTPNAPASITPFSQAIIYNGMILQFGQFGNGSEDQQDN